MYPAVLPAALSLRKRALPALQIHNEAGRREERQLPVGCRGRC